MARELDEYTLYGAGCSRVSVTHTGVAILRQMAERLMEDCQHAAWHSNAPFAPTPTAEIEFRDGRTERMAIRTNNHAFDAEAYLNRLDPRMSPFSGVSANHAAEQFSLLGRAAQGQTPPAPAAKPTKPATAPAPRSLLL